MVMRGDRHITAVEQQQKAIIAFGHNGDTIFWAQTQNVQIKDSTYISSSSTEL